MKTITHKTEKEGRVIMDYRKTAQEILGYVGGSKNIVSARTAQRVFVLLSQIIVRQIKRQ